MEEGSKRMSVDELEGQRGSGLDVNDGTDLVWTYPGGTESYTNQGTTYLFRDLPFRSASVRIHNSNCWGEHYEGHYDWTAPPYNARTRVTLGHTTEIGGLKIYETCWIQHRGGWIWGNVRLHNAAFMLCWGTDFELDGVSIPGINLNIRGSHGLTAGGRYHVGFMPTQENAPWAPTTRQEFWLTIAPENQSTWNLAYWPLA
jgi:hypothetical protein